MCLPSLVVPDRQFVLRMSRAPFLEFGPDHADREGAMRLVTVNDRAEQQEMPGCPQPIRAVDARRRTSL
jgi:hypothetical protein